MERAGKKHEVSPAHEKATAPRGICSEPFFEKRDRQINANQTLNIKQQIEIRKYIRIISAVLIVEVLFALLCQNVTFSKRVCCVSPRVGDGTFSFYLVLFGGGGL